LSDDAADRHCRAPRPGASTARLLVVLFVNWLVKPFSMALRGWLFSKHLFAGVIGPELGAQYPADAIILVAGHGHGLRVERENAELRRANEILRLASAYFAKAELDRRAK
jgi:hypothetical protein